MATKDADLKTTLFSISSGGYSFVFYFKMYWINRWFKIS